MALFNEDTYLYDSNANSSFFHLYAFGKLYPDSNYIISRKKNRDTIIECVLDGVGYIECGGVVTTVEKGDCYILKSGEAHSYYSDEARPYTKIWVTVSGSIVDKWLELYGINAPVFVRHLDITAYYSQIKQVAFGKPNLDREKRLMLLVHNIIFEMGLMAPTESKQQKSSAHYIKTSDNVIIDVKKYIEKQCNERLKMKDLALKFGMSPNTINRMFTEKYGMSPSKYHMQCKLDSAAYFLTSTDMSIDAISEAIGFFDRSHFCKAFQKQYNVSPSAYRKSFLDSQLSHVT